MKLFNITIPEKAGQTFGKDVEKKLKSLYNRESGFHFTVTSAMKRKKERVIARI